VFILKLTRIRILLACVLSFQPIRLPLNLKPWHLKLFRDLLSVMFIFDLKWAEICESDGAQLSGLNPDHNWTIHIHWDLNSMPTIEHVLYKLHINGYGSIVFRKF
jgi:hypothetical protein